MDPTSSTAIDSPKCLRPARGNSKGLHVLDVDAACLSTSDHGSDQLATGMFLQYFELPRHSKVCPEAVLPCEELELPVANAGPLVGGAHDMLGVRMQTTDRGLNVSEHPSRPLHVDARRTRGHPRTSRV